MRKKNFIFSRLSILSCMIIIVSCNDEQLTELQVTKVENELNLEKEKMLSLDSKKDLLSLIEQGSDFKSATTRTVERKFISLMDNVIESDPLMNRFTYEEQKYIRENELTYYDVLGYDELLPNENFAHLLNSKGDIQVSDTIYRITPYGTLYTTSEHLAELDAAHDNLVNKAVEFKDGDYEMKLSNHVRLINTFDRVALDDDSASSGSSAATSPGSSAAASSGSAANIPYQNFKRYSNESHTLLGKALSGLFGDRSTKHHDFMSGYRVKGSLYDYNYGVYSEIGAYVAMRKKRGGFLKAINGWKGTRADQLSIIYQGIVLEMELKIPDLKMPEKPTLINSNTKLNMSGIGKEMFCVDICGLSISEKDIMKLAGQGLKTGLAELKKLLNQDIKANTQAVRILTKNKLYIVIMDNPVHAYNVEKLRKVFSSGVQFYISSTMISNPLSVKAAADFYNGLRDLSVKQLKGGEVILAGKLNNNWGGMIIYKD